MSIIKEEFLLVRFSRLLKDNEPYPTTNVVINEEIATLINTYSSDVAKNQLGLSADSTDVQTNYIIQ